jgi:hypothetical protein
LCISCSRFSDDDFFIQVDFPFLVLLISGGHCLLAVAQAVDKFMLLGQSLDDAPGEAFDKVRIIFKARIKFVLMAEYWTWLIQVQSVLCKEKQLYSI